LSDIKIINDNFNIEILKNTTAIDADSSFKPKFVLEIVSLILTSTSSILGEVFKPDSSEQVKKQLQEIFNKLDSISRELNDIKLQIPCTASIQDFRNNVRINIQNLVDGVRTYFLTNDPVDRENLKIVCKDPSRGINYIYSAIKDLEYEHLKTIRDCARYHKNSIDGWAKTMMNLAAMFVFAHLGCEKAFEYKTTFDINRFESQIKSNVVYYVRKGFSEAAALDQGEFGVKPMAQKILNENVDAWTVFNRMNSIYPFNFHVIRYSAGIQGWDKHCSTTFGNALCGGYHWVRELDHGNNAYLGWCYEGNLNNQEIRLERDGNHTCNSKDRTINANPGMQFAYAMEFAGTDIRCQDLGDWTSVSASKFKDDSYYLQKVVLEPVSIFFP
jgi:BMFP domain-containing protein YqiC